MPQTLQQVQEMARKLQAGEIPDEDRQDVLRLIDQFDRQQSAPEPEAPPVDAPAPPQSFAAPAPQQDFGAELAAQSQPSPLQPGPAAPPPPTQMPGPAPAAAGPNESDIGLGGGLAAMARGAGGAISGAVETVGEAGSAVLGKLTGDEERIERGREFASEMGQGIEEGVLPLLKSFLPGDVTPQEQLKLMTGWDQMNDAQRETLVFEMIGGAGIDLAMGKAMGGLAGRAGRKARTAGKISDFAEESVTDIAGQEVRRLPSQMPDGSSVPQEIQNIERWSGGRLGKAPTDPTQRGAKGFDARQDVQIGNAAESVVQRIHTGTAQQVGEAADGLITRYRRSRKALEKSAKRVYNNLGRELRKMDQTDLPEAWQNQTGGPQFIDLAPARMQVGAVIEEEVARNAKLTRYLKRGDEATTSRTMPTQGVHQKPQMLTLEEAVDLRSDLLAQARRPQLSAKKAREYKRLAFAVDKQMEDGLVAFGEQIGDTHGLENWRKANEVYKRSMDMAGDRRIMSVVNDDLTLDAAAKKLVGNPRAARKMMTLVAESGDPQAIQRFKAAIVSEMFTDILKAGPKESFKPGQVRTKWRKLKQKAGNGAQIFDEDEIAMIDNAVETMADIGRGRARRTGEGLLNVAENAGAIAAGASATNVVSVPQALLGAFAARGLGQMISAKLITNPALAAKMYGASSLGSGAAAATLGAGGLARGADVLSGLAPEEQQ